MLEITAEDLKSSALEKEFEERLRDFVEDDSHIETYRRFKPRGDRVLVKVFKFVPSDPKLKAGEKSPILTVSKLDGTLKPAMVARHEKFFPIVKILKIGSNVSSDIKVGNLYVVPHNDVVGEKWNPDFQWMMQNFSKKRGDGKPSVVTIPDDMPQKLLAIDVQWERYKFSMPDRLGDETNDDKLVYLIPTLKIEADYLT